MHGTDRIDPDRLGGHRPRDAEVRHLHLAVTRDNHILRFDVPVHNMLVMCRCQPLRYLDGNSNRFFDAQMTFLENVAFQRDSLDEFHDDIMKTALIHNVINTHNIWMGKPCRRLRLHLEFADEIRILAVLIL